MASRATKQKQRNQRQSEDQNHLRIADIIPKTTNQQRVFDLYDDEKNLLLYGTAGTGKTFCAMYLALEELLSGQSDYKKIMVFRSVVPTRDMGFLPGSARDKAQVYEAPYYSICSELFKRGDAYEILKRKNLIEFTTTSFVRGITLTDCIVIIDEASNMTYHEIYSLVTRLGENTKLIVCGDTKQCDITNRYEKEGFSQFIQLCKRIKSMGVVQFTVDDIVRGPLVKEFIIADEELHNAKTVHTYSDKPLLAVA